MWKRKFFIATACLVTTLSVVGIVQSSASTDQPDDHSQPIVVAATVSLPVKPSNAISDIPVASAGCSASESLPTAATSEIKLDIDQTERSYDVYLPADYSNTSAHSLVLNYHGHGSSGLAQEQLSKFNSVADQTNAIIAYPNGTYDAFGKRGWDTGLHKTITSNDVLFTSTMLNQLQQNLCVSPTHIYATGLSNGGGFVNLLACDMSDRIAAFAPVSGSYVTPADQCHPDRPVPIMEFHGTADAVVHYDGNPRKHEPAISNWLANWAARDGCAATPTNQAQSNSPVIRYQWQGCDAGSSVVHYKLTGGIHAWPTESFDELSNGRIVQTNAAHIIWNFFNDHPLPTTPVTRQS
jgi:polyhydroxybutyrate depolymerase